MKKSDILYITFVIFIITACEKGDYELGKSVYIPDAEHQGLPAYTEWGYNTFGALYERKLFVYNDHEVPAKVIHTNGMARFVLKGELNESIPGYYGGYNYISDMSVSFELPGFDPMEYSDLVQLNSILYDLSDPELKVTMIIGTDTTIMDIFNGELLFDRAQNLIVDDEPVHVILSGHFGFQSLVNGEPVSMAYGRFDIGIGEYDFARY